MEEKSCLCHASAIISQAVTGTDCDDGESDVLEPLAVKHESATTACQSYPSILVKTHSKTNAGRGQLA